MGPSELFLSHADVDRDLATKVVEVLVGHGVPVWYSQQNLRGAQAWHDQIGQALLRCDWFAVVLTPAAVVSMWVKREVLFALKRKAYENRIVSLLCQPCDHESLSWTLSIYQWIDFTAGFDAGCKKLLRVWGIGYRGP